MKYERKYKEALEKARDYYEKDYLMINAALEKIFPELKESEDERIRKAIIDYFKHEREEGIAVLHYGVNIERMIAWLEKQGEFKSSKWTEGDVVRQTVENIPNVKRDKEISNDIIKFLELPHPQFVGKRQQEDWIAWLEKQGEQKPADKVEPKFHNGQWIVWQDKCYKVKYNGCGYELIDQNGLITSLEYGTIDENARLWTIQNAKEGEVLTLSYASQNYVLIYKGLNEKSFKTIMSVFCFYCVEEDTYYDGTDSFHVMNHGEIITPATKEQRDTLLKAMADAGYTFDFEKRELKKIEQKPEWSEEEYISYILTNCMNYAEKMGYVEEKNNRYIHQNAKLWLKSLKERHTWKPSEEQMKALNAINVTGRISYAGQGQELINLYNDLKKLKE